MSTYRASRAPVVAGALVAAFSLMIGFALKDQCTRHNWDGFQYRSSCYNDVFSLYYFRGLQHRVFPYIHGDGVLENEKDQNGNQIEIGDLEYPVVTGYYVGAIAAIVRDGKAFFRANVAGLALFGLGAVALTTLLARDRRRIGYFALAPSLMLYAFHNWDLLALFFLCAGLVAFRARRDTGAGVLLGIGAAAKVFPGLILPALALHRWREQRRVPWMMVLAAAGSFAAVNLPVLLANWVGWAFPWKFQSTRFPNFETSWYMIYRHLQSVGGGFWATTYPKLTSYLAVALFAAGAIALLRAEARRDSSGPHATAFGLLLIFLLSGKVYSPQYALWVLPFFVLVKMPWYSFAAFAITDAAAWFAVSAYFLAAPPLSAGDPSLRLTLLEIAVWVRYAVLVWLLWLTRRAPENVAIPEVESGYASSVATA